MVAAEVDESRNIVEIEGVPDLEARRELEHALDKCGGSFKRLVSPMLPYTVTLTYLDGELKACRERSGNSVQETHIAFALRMEEPGVKQYLEDLQARIRADIDSYEKVDDKWIEDFQNQIDYVPGLSKGKRLLDTDTAQHYMCLGEEMKAAGNKAFAEKDFGTALTRYTQGVELLSNVSCKDESQEKSVEQLLVALLSNQAVAGLRTDGWRVAVAACTACLAIDENNLKARCRRAEAYMSLGELEAAESDLYFVLTVGDQDVTDATLLHAARREARRALTRVATMREKERETAKRIVAGSRWSDGQNKKDTSKQEQEPPNDRLSHFAHLDDKYDDLDESEYKQSKPPSVRRSPFQGKSLSESEAIALQSDLEQLYQSDGVQQALFDMRKAADYEEGRFIRRLRPYLHQTVTPLLEKYGFEAGEKGYKMMESALGQHMETSPEIKKNAKKLLGVLLGDLADIEA